MRFDLTFDFNVLLFQLRGVVKYPFDPYLPSLMVRGTKPTKNFGIVLVFLVCLFVECQGQDVSGLSHIKNKLLTKHPSASATANYTSKTVGRGAAAPNGGKPRDFSPSNIAMSSQGFQDDLKKATIKKYLRGQRAQDIIVPSSISQSQPISPSPTPSHNLSNEISQSSYSRRRRLNPIYCDSVNNGVCFINSNITLTSAGIFTPSSLIFNGTSIGISTKSLVIQSTVECTSPLCKMTFQDFDLLQIAGSGGSLLGSDIRIDVMTLHVLQGAKVSGTSRGYVAGQGPSPGFVAWHGTYGAGHGGRGGYLGTQVYGSETVPTDFGSGGTNSAGGGRISINATLKVEVDGTISEDGGGCTETDTCASASGGSIYIASEEVLGTGSITANGGALAVNSTASVASGGGGRIAMYTNAESAQLTIAVSGGNLNNQFPLNAQGETGTIYRAKFESNTTSKPTNSPTVSVIILLTITCSILFSL